MVRRCRYDLTASSDFSNADVKALCPCKPAYLALQQQRHTFVSNSRFICYTFLILLEDERPYLLLLRLTHYLCLQQKIASKIAFSIWKIERSKPVELGQGGGVMTAFRSIPVWVGCVLNLLCRVWRQHSSRFLFAEVVLLKHGIPSTMQPTMLLIFKLPFPIVRVS